MISILFHKGKIFWPWGAILPDVNLELIGEEEITYNKEMREGDHKICCLVAYIHKATYQIIKFEYTYDFEKIWKNKGDDIIMKVTGDEELMDFFDPMSPSKHNPFIPELKTLSIDLLQLLGHPKEHAKDWITEGRRRSTFSKIGFVAIQQVLYAAFTVMKERMKNFNDWPKLPKHDEESLAAFREDLHSFIAELKYDEVDLHSMTIGDLFAMGR